MSEIPEDKLQTREQMLAGLSNCGQSAEPDHWKFRQLARETARSALTSEQPVDGGKQGESNA